MKEMGQESEESLYNMGRDGIEGVSELIERETASDRAGEVTSLERKLDRTIYFMVNDDGDWHFRECSFGARHLTFVINTSSE